jgi:hypothetical protein
LLALTPARHGKPEWRFECVCSTPTVAYHQRRVLIEWSSVERLPAKSVDERTHWNVPCTIRQPPYRLFGFDRTTGLRDRRSNQSTSFDASSAESRRPSFGGMEGCRVSDRQSEAATAIPSAGATSTTSPTSPLSPDTLFYNSARRTGSSALHQLCCRLGLLRGRAPDTVHSSFARFASRSARGARQSIFAAWSGHLLLLPVCVGAHS